MSEQRPSRQEVIRRRRRTGFVGRRNELGIFRDNFTRNLEEETYQFIFHVHGNAGVGKTSLIRQWETVARELGAVSTYVDDDVHSALEAMEAVSTQLGKQGLALKGFDKALATYRQRLHEAETAPGGQVSAETTTPGQAVSVSSTVAAQVGLAGLSLLPGVGVFTAAVNPQQIAQGADRLRAMLSIRLRNHDDVRLVMSPVQVLTPLFLEDLAEVARRRPWVVLFFDVYERTGPVLDTWLRDVLVTTEYGELPVNVQVVLSGQGRLDARCWGDWLDLIAEVPLEVFTDTEARQLMAAKGITDERVIEVVLRLSGRLPVLVDTLAQRRPHSPDAVGDPSGTAVERFLKWETDPHRRTAALACALPLQLDEDIYRAAVPEAAADQYPWLRALPFVTGQGGRCRYHDVVRAPMLRLQRAQSPAQWQTQQTRLADTFQQWRHSLEATLAPEDRWDDGQWREHRLAETYHRLCANPNQALPDALLELVRACAYHPAALRRWAQIVTQAGLDAASDKLTEWGQRLETATEDDTVGSIPALTVLLTATELSTAGQAFARAIRGREHRNADNFDAALTDYTTALALDADLARAHSGRGRTYFEMGRYGEALVDLTRAIELNPNDSGDIALRGQTYGYVGQYEEALTDLTRAIELNPQYDWALTGRGEIYRSTGRYDDALTDFARALELNPDDTWILAERGYTYWLMSRFEDALIDLTRALEIDSTYVWALTNRGTTQLLMGRHEGALTDLTRAIELNPTYTLPITQRGTTYRDMGRYDDALIDFTRAVDLDPTNDRHFAARGHLYRLLGRQEDALTDLAHAIELNPANAWATAQRGDIYRLMERYDDALADFSRAAELDPQYLASRGETYRLMERWDDASRDIEQALEADPSSLQARFEAAMLLSMTEETDRARQQWEEFDRLLETSAESSTVKTTGLFVARCALADWGRADTLLAAWLTSNPDEVSVAETLLCLNSLARSPHADAARLETYLTQLSRPSRNSSAVTSAVSTGTVA
ncbi:tetratricopeptide repeat protein [Streptomyces longisporus]|uniref:Tetratricopeptide repeat protein n=1 Tax=Streptomyces longisporus TaxID=1948 RepID=A0ABN3NKB7_STRLO